MLSFFTHSHPSKEQAMSEPTCPKSGNIPYKVAVEAGVTYAWCACGKSKSQPMCDGSHQGGSILPLSYTADVTGDKWFCGCKQSSTKPLCDGSHKKL
jgi:CDGSH iron-sulfur domain-containing protein 3